MHTAIHHPRRIASAQKKLRRRVHQELQRIGDVVVGFRGGKDKLEVFTNNIIWVGYECLKNRSIPAHGNVLGIRKPALPPRSNNITVEVNIAIRGVGGVAGLFAVDDETGHIVLLHNGRIGGGQRGVGPRAFKRWYREKFSGRLVQFIDRSRRSNKEKQAILVADVESSEFLVQLESFVDAVHRFKTSRRADDPTKLSDTELERKAAAAPTRPGSYTMAGVVYARDRHVAELAKRRADGKCELCGEPAPFTNASNEPYLESHHIVWLAHGGFDNIDNTVALCPNCHRKMHVVNDAKDVKKLKDIKKRIRRTSRSRIVVPGGRSVGSGADRSHREDRLERKSRHWPGDA